MRPRGVFIATVFVAACCLVSCPALKTGLAGLKGEVSNRTYPVTAYDFRVSGHIKGDPDEVVERLFKEQAWIAPATGGSGFLQAAFPQRELDLTRPGLIRVLIVQGFAPWLHTRF